MYPRYKVMILMVSVMSIHESGATGDVFFSCYLSGVCFMEGKTIFSATKHKQQSMILVDINTLGVQIKKPSLVLAWTCRVYF